MQVTFAYLMKEISDESNTENTLQSTHRNGGGKKAKRNYRSILLQIICSSNL